jgi:propanol-preferring alcohol dehydrogenase
MRALVLRRFGEPLVLEERPAPVPRANQMLVRVRAARICGSDVHIAAGRVRVELPLVAMKSPARATNSARYSSMPPGAAVAAGTAERVRSNYARRPRRQAGRATAGSLRQCCSPRAGTCSPLDGLDPAQAAPLADASVTAYRAVHRATDSLGRNTIAVVIGAGGLGQFAIQYLRLLTDAHTRRPHCRDQRRGRARRRGRWTAQL